ncbi:hypothetical protein LCGC14_0958890 [marine sediment metagenome]|uniref:Uncharacterized protein n=1 Tax=marine sediment metagenome TaxID=412755 RepID=A0A0F9QYA7_9ZZZZ|nr:hypothetical protein [archaeon]
MNINKDEEFNLQEYVVNVRSDMKKHVIKDIINKFILYIHCIKEIYKFNLIKPNLTIIIVLIDLDIYKKTILNVRISDGNR